MTLSNFCFKKLTPYIEYIVGRQKWKEGDQLGGYCKAQMSHGWLVLGGIGKESEEWWIQMESTSMEVEPKGFAGGLTACLGEKGEGDDSKLLP